jgi:hypothetical protein
MQPQSRRFAAFSVALVAVLGVSGSGLAQSQTLTNTASGQGTVSDGPEGQADFNFSATSGSNGENPQGSFEFFVPRRGDFRVSGQITCLHVTGNTAALYGLITQASGPFSPNFIGTPVFFSVADNASLGIPDTMIGPLFVTPLPGECLFPITGVPPADLLSGDITVGQGVAPPSQGGGNRARACKAERAQLGDVAFRAKYGTNRNGANAHGKCVSQNH